MQAKSIDLSADLLLWPENFICKRRFTISKHGLNWCSFSCRLEIIDVGGATDGNGQVCDPPCSF